MLLVNGTILHLLPGAVHQNLMTLRRCHALLRVADRLGAIRATGPVPQLTALAAMRGARVWLRRTFGLLDLFQLPVLDWLGTWLNFLCLTEVILYISTLSRLARLRPGLIATHEQVASLDAALAVACLLERFPAHCRPVITAQRQIEIQDGCHPLLERPVANSLSLRATSALITGSNMTGKTTFIKMVATNLILGRALGVCLAARAVIPQGRVMACIHGDHSIESGRSKYFGEVEAMLGFLTHARAGESPVIVIDEPFSGTNTVERVAAAKAVLAALAPHALVLATTHDGELQPLLAPAYEPYHFRESPEVEGFFDHRVHAGPSRQSNALRLLGALGFPQDVVDDALAIAAARDEVSSAAARA